jgi:23S rRNA pseudouridine2605 synthase
MLPRERRRQSPRRTPPRRPGSQDNLPAANTGLARALSKLGFCSRAQAFSLVRAGRVKVNGALARDAEQPTRPERDRIEVDGQVVRPAARVYLLLNKPRGLVTTTADERGRPTVFDCLKSLPAESLPRVAPVGRLDQASEGLLLFTNDTAWAARITDPASHLDKTYHTQVDCVADEALCRRIEAGVEDAGEQLRARRASVLRSGQKNSWLEIVLDEGRNRHIRRLLAALGMNVLRLVRVAVGPLPLGDLPKGAVRHLTAEEVRALA